MKLYDWARFRSQKGAVKRHLLLDYQECLPVFAQVTEGKTHDRMIVDQLSFPKGSIVVFDRAYMDYKWLNNLDSNQVNFVTRAKKNTCYQIKKVLPFDARKHTQVTGDYTIKLKGESYPKQLRLVRYLDSTTGKAYEFITNNFHWNAQTVPEIYKERWHIEVFFKHIKQNLNIKSFVDTSENAVQIQVWTSPIAMLILTYLKNKATYNWHLSNMITFIRLNLFVKIVLTKALNQPFYNTKTIYNNTQLLLFSR